MSIKIIVANSAHADHAVTICEMMEVAAKSRGTGIAKRKPTYLKEKMALGQAIIAFDDKKVVGFSYIESWEGQKYVAHSGLIVHPDYRKTGLAKAIKEAVFQLSKKKFPMATIFGITTSMAVMKINAGLGYQPVTFSELTNDKEFWDGCKSCVNYDILQRTEQRMCLCTAMVCKPTFGTKPSKKSGLQNFNRFLKHRKIQFQRKVKYYPLLFKTKTNEK